MTVESHQFKSVKNVASTFTNDHDPKKFILNYTHNFFSKILFILQMDLYITTVLITTW